jgi:hypothetical protein
LPTHWMSWCGLWIPTIRTVRGTVRARRLVSG